MLAAVHSLYRHQQQLERGEETRYPSSMLLSDVPTEAKSMLKRSILDGMFMLVFIAGTWLLIFIALKMHDLRKSAAQRVD